MYNKELYNKGGFSFSIQIKPFSGWKVVTFSGFEALVLTRDFCCFSGAIAGIVDQPMQNFQRTTEAHASAGHRRGLDRPPGPDRGRTPVRVPRRDARRGAALLQR